MATTLASLPNELLLQICRRLASNTDVSNFRLVCRLFGEVGLPALGTKVTFTFVPESINRLRDISLHPVFRRHTTTVVCLMNVFYPYKNLVSWKQSMTKRLASGYHATLVAGFSEHDWADSMSLYNILISAQNEAFKALGPSKDIQTACGGFLNLQNLHIRDDREFWPDHLCSNQAYKLLSQRHGGLTNCSVLPVYDFSVFPQEIALPGVYMLSSLLGAIGESQLRTLQVDALALQVFEQEGGVYNQMKKSVQNLRTLKLRIWVASADDEREKADQILFKNRLKNFLCAAPHLEDLEININGAFFGTGLYYANSAHVLPEEYTWPRLRKLRFSQVEFVTTDFLEFLRLHGNTLEYFGLTNCTIVGPPNPNLQTPQCCWSDILIPLATTYSLTTLSLSGWLVPDFFEQGPNQEIRISPAMNMEDDTVQDVNISIGKAIELVTCSKEFDSFLHGEVGRRNGLAPEIDGDIIKGLVVDIKEGIIRDLVDREPVTPEEIGTDVIPTRYSDYLKLFTLVTLDHREELSQW